MLNYRPQQVTELVSARVTPTMAEQLRQMAADREASVGSTIRFLIRQALEVQGGAPVPPRGARVE